MIFFLGGLSFLLLFLLQRLKLFCTIIRGVTRSQNNLCIGCKEFFENENYPSMVNEHAVSISYKFTLSEQKTLSYLGETHIVWI